MKAMIGPLVRLEESSLSMEFYALLYEDDGTPIQTISINVPYTAATNQNQLLPLAKAQVIEQAQAFVGRTLSTNDIKSAVLQ